MAPGLTAGRPPVAMGPGAADGATGDRAAPPREPVAGGGRADAIVVGGGTAGCIVAGRLVERGRTVILIEAGPGGPPPAALLGSDATAALDRDDRFWPGTTAVVADGPSVPHREGRGLGGGSAVNTLVAMTGDRRDYDRWVDDHGCDGWAWVDLAPWLDASLATWPGPPADPGPLARAFTGAALGAGHPRAASSALVDLRGVAPVALMTVEGRRRSMADVHLGPHGASRPGLEIRSGTTVSRLLAGPATGGPGGATVRGVELADGSTVTGDVVVLAAGALRSPRLLARSGLLDPGRPRPLQDHPSFVFTVELRPGARNEPGERAPVTSVLRWATAADDTVVDATALVMDHVGPGPTGRRHGAVIVELTESTSRGRLPLDGDEPVRFEPGWLATAHDRARLRSAVRHVAEMLAGPEVREVARRVLIDDAGTEARHLRRWSDDELDRWLVAHPGPVSHVAGTCPMGSDPGAGAVVDTTGAVHGHRGIHVVDASVLPVLPAANLQVPVMAVAERLARALP